MNGTITLNLPSSSILVTHFSGNNCLLSLTEQRLRRKREGG